VSIWFGAAAPACSVGPTPGSRAERPDPTLPSACTPASRAAIPTAADPCCQPDGADDQDEIPRIPSQRPLPDPVPRDDPSLMKASDVMTSPAVSLEPDTPVPEAADLLSSHGFTAAPVLDADGRLVGMVSEADLVRSPVVPDWWQVQREADPTVAEVMNPAPAVMGPEDDLADVVALMLDARVRSIPIVDDGEVVGIVTQRDVLRAVARREMILGDRTPRRQGGARPLT
jgi:CBS domain-containing protein